MSPQQFWFRDLNAAGKGPDWIFNASFTLGSAALLSDTFRALVPHEFTYYRASQSQCPIHSRWCDYDLFIDSTQYEAMIAHIEDRRHENIYVYHTMQACQNDYQLVRGYGGYPGQHGSEETRCLRALIQTANLIMIDWSIVYGGMTYPYEEWLRGTTAAELMRYLDTQS